jgi:SAM-dependent methyltransferase
MRIFVRLRQRLKGRGMTHAEDEWFADESFWITSYDVTFPESRFSVAAAEVAQILNLVQRTEGRVVDLACGPGRHSIPLAQRGFLVTGVDRSAFLLERARERAARSGVVVEWLQADMRDFRRADSFDLALSLFTSFGFFRDDADNQRVLSNVADSLRAGGAFVLDMGGKEVLARIFNPTASREVPGGLLVQRRRVTNDWSRMENEWILLRDGVVHTFRIDHWIYSGREIKQMFSEAGFASVQLFGNYLGAPYGPEAARLVVVGRKAARRGAA